MNTTRAPHLRGQFARSTRLRQRAKVALPEHAAVHKPSPIYDPARRPVHPIAPRLQLAWLRFTMSERVLDVAHKVIGGLLITATVAGSIAIGYGVYSFKVLRREHLAAVAAQKAAETQAVVDGAAAAPTPAADAAAPPPKQETQMR